jgi:hypothetical protein
MALNRDQHRALRLLADAPNGATATIMLARGFTISLLDDLVLRGAGDDGKACHARGAAADQGDVADDHRGWAAGAWMMGWRRNVSFRQFRTYPWYGI